MSWLWKSALVFWWNLWTTGQPAQEFLASSCAGCHPAEVAEWETSRHAVAFTNGLFRAEFDARRTAWCASCHAPAAGDPREVADDNPVAQQGVGCMTCHLNRTGQWVSGQKGANSPHPTQASEDFGSAEFCGQCHEFRFPIMGEDGMPTGFRDLAMQETMSQFQETASAKRGEDCRSCHMNSEVGAHRFVGSHDLPTLQSALQWETCRVGDELIVELTNVGAAHSIPTGGVNRHMVLRVWLSTAPQATVQHFIGRRFEGAELGGKTLVLDTTLAAGESRPFTASLAALAAEPSTSEPINVELRYIYPLDEFAELAPGTHRFATVFRERKLPTEFALCSSP